MAASDKKIVHLQGPWKGLMEYPHECGDGQLQDCLNVDFDGNWIVQRPGRTKLAVRRIARPASIIDSNTWTLSASEVSANLLDGSTSTEVMGLLKASGFPGQANEIFIGSPWPFTSAAMTVGHTVNAATASLSASYLGPAGWTAVSGLSDGTTASGKAFAQSGVISWTQPGDWIEGAEGKEANSTFDQRLFWIRIRAGAPLDGGWYLAEARIGYAAAPINGLFHLTLRDGSKRLFVGMDDQGASGAAPRSPTARIAWYDEAADEYVPIRMPAGAKQSGADAYYSFVAVNDYLLFTNGVGPILRYNVTKGDDVCAVLEAVQGKDSAQRSYLPAVPRGRYLAYFQGRLYVAGSPASPYTVQFSEVEGADNIIPSDGTAPVGGPNVWPAGNDFDISTGGSDQIAGLVESYDRRLVIFSRNSIHVFDGNELLRAENRVGCIAPRSIVPVGQEIYFLSALGVFVFSGSAAEHISYPVQPTLDKIIHKGAIANVVGVNVPGARQYRLFVPIPLHYQNRMALVRNYQRKTWSKWAGLPPWYSEPQRAAGQEMNVCAAAVAEVGTEDELLITGDYAGNLWAEDRGVRDNGKFPLAFAAFRVIGDDDEGVKTWRDWRGGVVMSGCSYRAALLTDGAVFSGRSGADASPLAADAAKRAAFTSQPTWNVGNTWPIRIASGGPNKRTAEVKLSVGRSGRQAQPVIYANGVSADGNYADDSDATLAIRGIDVEFRPQRGRR